MKNITKLFAAMALTLPFLNAEADDYGFGDMGGVFNVSESGAATYTLPFDLPDGINGMQPSLGLVYNSQSGNGAAGMGVSIYGTSVITRTAKDIFHDGVARGVVYNDNDVYSLDGIRLIQIAQNDYRPENSPADYITKSSTGFTATLQNGNIAYYDYKVSAGGYYAWYMNKVEDPFGNVIYYNYSNDNGCIYLTSVQYGTNLGVSTGLTNVVTFEYETRNDITSYIVNGVKCSMRKRLKSITVKTNNVERNKYTLTYSSADAFSRLSKIEESYGTTKLPAVTLGWKAIPSFSITAETIASSSDISKYATSGDFLCADLTGDGISDMVQITEGSSNSVISVYSASVSSGTTTFTRTINSASINVPNSSPFLIGDMEGDGVSELLAIKSISTSSSDYISTISNKTRVVSLASGSMPVFTTSNFYNNGKTDIVYLLKNGNTYLCRILNLNGSSTRKVESSLTIGSEPKRMIAGDFNNDGMNDLIIIHESGYTIFWNQGVKEGNSPFSDSKKTSGTNLKQAWLVRSGDFNGDGLADFLTNATDNDNWYFYLNNGNGTFTQKLACTMDVHDNSFTDKDNERFSCLVYDFNNDGKDDVVVTKAQYNRKTNILKEEWGVFQKTYTYWIKSDGSTLQTVKTASSNKDEDALTERYVSGDFNGDGYVELMNFGYNCYGSTDANVASSWRLYKNSSVTANTNKLTSISVGQSGTYTSITYSTLCDASVYTRGGSSTYPIASVGASMNVVKQVMQNLAYNYYYTNYKYSGLRIHLQGRGMLGFTTVEANNSTTGIKRTTTINSLNTTYYEPSKITTTITRDGKTDVTETSMTTITYMGKSHLTYPSTIKNTDIYNSVTTTTNEYQSIYYPTKQRTEYDGSSMYKQVEYKDYTTAGRVFRPKTVITTQKHKDDGTAFTSKTTYTYNSNGTVAKMIENASTVPVTHEYTYSTLGNMLTHKVSASGITTVTTTRTYDATNRYVASEKSSANSLIANYTYNNLGRLTKKQEGLSGSLQTTNYSYDAVGNIVKIIYPDGTSTTYTRSWGTMPYKRYSVTSKTAAQASVTTWYDNLGREVESSSTGEKGVSLTSTTSYDMKSGKVSLESNKKGNISLSNNYSYNNLGQLTKSVTSAGQTINYSHSKRSIAATQGNTKYYQESFDAWGNLSSVSHNYCSSASYKYGSCGQPTSISYSDAGYQSYTVATMAYDSRGQQTSLTDADAGATSYEYDALGRVTKQTDAKGNVTTNTYNASGLLTKQVCGGVATDYTYDNRLRLTKETTGSQSVSYTYDTYDRLTQKTYTIDGTSLSYSYVYNSYGQMTAQTFPDGMTETYTYDSYGNLATIKIGGQRVWELSSYNGTYRTIKLGEAPLTLSKSYSSSSGALSSTTISNTNGPLHIFSYTFDGSGNLTNRYGMTNGNETFSYDEFDRLKTGVSYFINGNINSKTGIGNYTYDANKKNAVVQVQNSGNLIPKENVDVTYNAFNKVSTVTQGSNKLTITYGPDRQRVKTVLVYGGATTTTLYAGNYEQRTAGGVTTTYHYVASPDGLIAVYVKKNGATTPYYVETDHLGSIINLFDASGTKQFSATYDAWGKQTITKNAIGLTRGYTGHEHWNQFGLIDMNGRFYDPLIGRFLSPDPYVQAPGNPQNFNRYSYCLNNPLKYTDPTGEKWWHWLLGDILTGGLISSTVVATGIAAYLSPNSTQGYELQKMVSPIAVKFPTLSLGSIQNGIGFDFSVGLPKCMGIGYRFNYGATYYSDSYCNYNGWEIRKGGEYFFALSSYSATEFKSGETSQVTHLFSFGIPFANLEYENDMKIDFLEKLPGVPHGGTGDRYRTAAVQINAGLISTSLNIVTGDYCAGEDGKIKVGGYYEYISNNGYEPDKYRAGVLSIGFGSFRIGRNSEKIRAAIQNTIHDWIDCPRFHKMDITPEWFWGFGQGSGNTLW